MEELAKDLIRSLPAIWQWVIGIALFVGFCIFIFCKDFLDLGTTRKMKRAELRRAELENEKLEIEIAAARRAQIQPAELNNPSLPNEMGQFDESIKRLRDQILKQEAEISQREAKEAPPVFLVRLYKWSPVVTKLAVQLFSVFVIVVGAVMSSFPTQWIIRVPWFVGLWWPWQLVLVVSTLVVSIFVAFYIIVFAERIVGIAIRLDRGR